MVVDTGNASGLRDTGHVWGAKAQAAESQVRSLRSTATSIGIDKFQGGAADRMRTYVGQLETSASTIATAFDQLANAAPRVADAVEDDQDAKEKEDKAKTTLDAKTKELDTARQELQGAQQAVHQMHFLTGTGAPSPAAQQAVREAQAKVDRLVPQVDRARRDWTKAQDAHQRTTETRDRLTRAFQALVQKQTAATRTAMQNPPVAPQVPPALNIIKNLKPVGGLVLANLQAIVKYNEVTRGAADAGAVAAALEKWTERANKVSKGAGYVLPVLTTGLKVLTNPNLSTKEKERGMTKGIAPGVLGGEIGGAAGGAACAPTVIATPVCAAGGALIGGTVAPIIAKIKPVDRALNLVSDTYVAPVVHDVDHIIHPHSVGDVASSVLDLGKGAPQRTVELGAKAISHPKKTIESIIGAF